LYGRHLKKLSFILHRLLLKTFSIPSSLLLASDKNTCIRQTTATIYGEKAILIHTSTGVRHARHWAVTGPLRRHCTQKYKYVNKNGRIMEVKTRISLLQV
jgi:hypothetical protein